MNLAIVGSRTILDPFYLNKAYKRLISHCPDDDIISVISGGAKGVDSMAKDFAEHYKVPLTVFYPDWDTHGKAAGFIRNEKIIKNATHVIAVWDGVSKGTLHSIKLSRSWNKHLVVYNTKDDTLNYFQPTNTLFK